MLFLKAYVGPLQCAKGAVYPSLVLTGSCGNPKLSRRSQFYKVVRIVTVLVFDECFVSVS